ncbi:hypothetical protein FRC18_007477 [Serendipita sp. 400]|nr:hypothetical protein FRC18_007477 [Serendipita sp. 400]
MDQQNGNQQATRRSSNASGSLLILIFIVYLLWSGDSNTLPSQDDINNSLQSLRDEYSNYTAWLDGQPSNFTLNYESHAFANLRDSFLHPTEVPVTTPFGHYKNITGTYKTRTVIFRNLTHPPKEVSWGELADAAYSGRNLSRVHQMGEGWNWTQPVTASISISSYLSAHLSKNSTKFYRIKGLIELEIRSPKQNLVELPSIELRHEGIHFPRDGSMLALVEPKHITPDIRQLPALVPSALENVTAQMIAGQLKDGLSNFEKQARAGTLQLSNAEDPPTQCSFIFYGHMRPVLASRRIISAYEHEMQSPSGIPLPNLPKPTFNGVLMSEECGIALEFDTVQGTSDRMFNRRMFTYCAIASAIYYMLLQLSLQVSDQWRTTTNLLRGSRAVMATWLIADIYTAVAHLMAAVMTTETRYALLFPGVLAAILVATDVRLITYLNSVQLLLHPPNPTPTPPTAPTAALQTQNQPTSTPVASHLVQNVPVSSPRTIKLSLSKQEIQAFSIKVINFLYANDFRAWGSTVALLSFFSFAFLGVPVYGVWFLIIASTWLGQITRNIFQRSRRVLRHDTVILSSIFRLFMPMYLFACPDNLLNIEPVAWIPIIPIWVLLQTAILIGQDYFGPTWFIPDIWNKEDPYDYHPDLVRTDEESIESRLGDCSICMEPISADQSDLGVERGRLLQLWWKQAAKKRRVYAMAPCGHNFHTKCLEQWMEIKTICPQCRGLLPPI